MAENAPKQGEYRSVPSGSAIATGGRYRLVEHYHEELGEWIGVNSYALSPDIEDVRKHVLADSLRRGFTSARLDDTVTDGRNYRDGTNVVAQQAANHLTFGRSDWVKVDH